MVGSALVRKLNSEGFNNIITHTSSELNLTNQQAVADFFAREKPDYVFNIDYYNKWTNFNEGLLNKIRDYRKYN